MDTNITEVLTGAASDIGDSLPVIIAAAIVIFLGIAGVKYLKKAFKSGAA